MNWNNITTENQIEELIKRSSEKPILIFKHSSRCSISAMAKSRVERSWAHDSTIEPYFLDLIRYRAVSNEVALKLGVEHESPQAILLKDGQVAHHSSHMGISVDAMIDSI